MWYASSCSGTISRIGSSSSCGVRAATITWSADLARLRPVVLAGDGDHDASARLHFLNVRERLLVADAALFAGRIARGDHHHRQILVDQRVGPVLHLAGRIALGVDVGDLLELQRAFERDREVDAAAQEQEIGGAEQRLAPVPRRSRRCERIALQLARQPQQLLHRATASLSAERVPRLPQVHAPA